jgi:transglutaminase-like putative cysteine protease
MIPSLLTLFASAAPAVTSGHPIDVQIIVGRVQYVVQANEATRDAWVQFPIPIAYRGQTPMAEVVVTAPPDKASRLSIVSDGTNRYLRVDLHELAPDERVVVHSKTFVLVRREVQPFGEGVVLPGPAEVPADVKRYLDSVPGLDAGDPRIQKIAKGFGRRDLKSEVDELFDFLSKNVKAEAGSGPQGALNVLERGSAEPAGSANLATSILIAAKIPARIVSCISIVDPKADYFLVEAWTQKLGWSKIDPTLHTFPLDDSKHLVMRFVEPSSIRSKDSVPVYMPVVHGVSAAFDPPTPDRPWGSAEVLESQQVPEEEVEAIEAAARKAFDGLIGKPVPWARAVLVPHAKAPAVLKARGKKILELVESRLDK